MDLLENNGGCGLPCWWGITPGETRWVIAKHFLASFASGIEQGESGRITEDGIAYWVTNFDVEYKIINEPSTGLTIFDLRNGIISGITAYPPGTNRSYQLHQLLSKNGKPEEIKGYYGGSHVGLPLWLVLFYPNRGILAMYTIESTVENGIIKSCPQGIGPELWLWSPDRKLEINDLIFGGLADLLWPIEEYIKGMDIETFYQSFKDPNSSICIEGPDE